LNVQSSAVTFGWFMSAKASSVTAFVLLMDFEIQKAGILLCRSYQVDILEPSLLQCGEVWFLTCCLTAIILHHAGLNTVCFG